MIEFPTVIAANRFGLGARPGELQRINGDHRRWLLGQISRPPATPAAVHGLKNSADIVIAVSEFADQRKAFEQQASGKDLDAADVRKMVGRFRDITAPEYRAQVEARYTNAVETEAPFHERLVYFWSNHFAVSVDKPSVLGLAGTLENEAIRPHVTGNFHDMLVAVEQHPAMLLYLDNQASMGPNSKLASRANRGKSGRKFDINENLAREILELHTLGVDGGYDQDDVTTFAKVLTGWSIGGGRGRLKGGTPGEFYFRSEIHEPGTQTILGRTYKQKGVTQGEAVLDDLAVQPATARYVATKLVRHFVADEPPEQTVYLVEQAFLRSGGDLPTVYRALIESPEAWQQPLAKYKTPQDFLISAHRALDVAPQRVEAIYGPLEQLGQRPYSPGSPAGWPDEASGWDGADALMKRIEWAGAAGARAGSVFDARDVAQQSLGPVLGTHTREAIERAESGAQALTLLLASPEFQQR